MPDGGIKNVLTYRLLNQFMDWGLFEMDKMVATTAFGHKPHGASMERFAPDRTKKIVEEVRTEWREYLRDAGLPPEKN